MTVRLSVLMPAFGPHAFVAKAVTSFLDNTRLEELELVLQNGGPPLPGGPWSEHPQVVLREEPDSGQADALNRAADCARGGYLGWLNSDDLYEPGALDAVLAELDAAEAADVVFGGYRLVDAEGAVLREFSPLHWDHDEFMRRGCYIYSGAFFVRRALWAQAGGLDPSFHYCMDLDLFLRLPRDLAARRVDRPLGALRIHPASKTGSQDTGFVREAYRVRRAAHPEPTAVPAALVRAGVLLASQVAQPIRYSRVYSAARHALRGRRHD